MAIPADRYKLLPLRGTKANLDAGITGILDGEICYAIDEDQYYQKEGLVLVSVGAAKAQGVLAESALQPEDIGSTVQGYDANTVIDDLYVRTDENFTTADHTKLDGIEDGAEVNPVNVSELVNDAGYITVAEVPPGGVTSVNTQTGEVVLDASDVGALAPGDNNSSLTNDAGYITLAEVPPGGVTSVNTQTGDVVLSATDVGALAPGTVNPVYFADQAAFPDPTANHGAVAHSHADGAMFFAHGGAWNRMANSSEIPPVNNLNIAALPVLP